MPTRTVPDMPHMLFRRHCLTAFLCLPLAIAQVGAQPSDTTKISSEPLFTRRDAYMALGFLALTAAATPLDERIAQRLQRSGAQDSKFLENASTGVEYITAPGAYFIGGALYGVGRLTGNERMADLGWHGTEAVIVGTGVFVLGKGLFGRARPETVDAKDARNYHIGRGFGGGAYASFPSGHSTTAFAAASAVTAETWEWWPRARWIIAPTMYGGATMVGLSRMYHNKHWASDVAMGALLGTFAGLKVVRYHHSHPGNRLDRLILGRTSMVVSPTGNVALALVVPVDLRAR